MINDIPVYEFIVSKLWKFADDEKYAGRFWIVIKFINIWSLDWHTLGWHILFNVDKCTVVHIGCNNLECECNLGDRESIIRILSKEMDRFVIISGKQISVLSKY